MTTKEAIKPYSMRRTLKVELVDSLTIDATVHMVSIDATESA